MSIDFFIVPTIRFKLLFVLVVLEHSRRKVLHFNVTGNPTAQWTAQQIVEAFPWRTAPKYLLRDRDAIYGSAFQRRVRSMGIEQVLSAPRSTWQKAYASHCTSCERIGMTAGNRRLSESLVPWHLVGGTLPGGS